MERHWTVFFQNDRGGVGGSWSGRAADIDEAIRKARHQWPMQEMIYAGLTGFQP